jgi:hypothetical protein
LPWFAAPAPIEKFSAKYPTIGQMVWIERRPSSTICLLINGTIVQSLGDGFFGCDNSREATGSSKKSIDVIGTGRRASAKLDRLPILALSSSLAATPVRWLLAPPLLLLLGG